VSRDPRLDEVFRALDASESSRRYQQVAKAQVAVALTSPSIPLADLTPAALLQFAWNWRDATRAGAGTSDSVRCWHGGAGTDGPLPAGHSGHAAAHTGRRPPRHHPAGGRYPVRNPRYPTIVDRLSESPSGRARLPLHRRPELRSGPQLLAGRGIDNPEQTDLNLDEQTYQVWLTQVSVIDGPYGTPCAHEHACIRCPMLQINPKMLPRLDELEADLLTRKARAESEG
jgi:hypothetical protein